MSNIVPFDFSAKPPAIAQQRRVSKINQDVMIGGLGFPVLSIKGKVFALVKDNERKIITRQFKNEDGEIEAVPVAAMQVAVARANVKGRTYYGSGYTEGESDGNKPDCFSHDGQYPDASSKSPQAKSCAACPHSQWGSKVSNDREAKGTACAPRTRLAIVDPNNPSTPFLLSLPPASRMAFNDAVKKADIHGYDYNQVVFRMSFDQEAATPKLNFDLKGLLADEAAAKVSELFDNEVVQEICGKPNPGGSAAAHQATQAAGAEQAAEKAAEVIQKAAAAAPKPQVTPEELDGALSGAVTPTPAPAPAKKTTRTKPPAAAPAPAPAAEFGADDEPAPAPAPVARAAAPAPAVADDDALGLLGELGSLLGQKDD